MHAAHPVPGTATDEDDTMRTGSPAGHAYEADVGITTPAQTARARVRITAIVAVAELAHLGWEHLHGGIASHHLFNRADLPAISNAWGAVFLPALAWFLAGIVLRRAVDRRAARGIGIAFFGALAAGVTLSATFLGGHESAASAIFLGIGLSGLVLRVYRGEYVLGFVLGMTFAIGAMLPTLVASCIAALSAVVHLVLRPLGIRVARHMGMKAPARA